MRLMIGDQGPPSAQPALVAALSERHACDILSRMEQMGDMSWLAVALVASVTHLKLFVLAAVQGVTRISTKQFAKPEDAATFGGGVAPVAEEHPRVVLAQRAINNELENLPTFGFALIAHAALGGSGTWAMGLAFVFVLARCVHSAAYVRPTQPLRNRAYLVGQLATFTLIVRIAITLLTRT